jgi:sugar phosphate isomerase/epimerase
MTEPREASEIMSATDSSVKMLLDVAHLKVSANTLGFEPSSMFKQCHQWIEAYHLSDNNGLEDQNNEVTKNSWFWPYLNKELDYYSLEVYTRQYSKLLSQIELTDKILSS